MVNAVVVGDTCHWVRMASRAVETFGARLIESAVVGNSPDATVKSRNDLSDLLIRTAADVVFTVGLPWILPPDILALPPLGVVNVHSSRLPDLRGPDPIARAVLRGSPIIWCSAYRMTPKVDAGPILAVTSTRVDDVHEPVAFDRRILGCAYDSILRALSAVTAGSDGYAQVGRATYAPNLTPDEAWLRPTEPANVAIGRVRAFALCYGQGGLVPLENGKVLLTRRVGKDAGAIQLRFDDAELWLDDIRPVKLAANVGMRGQAWPMSRVRLR